ncbi:MAG: hypothetical protein E7Z80_08020, partial [Methanobrevibacter thaueri]|nr:hypothetical protein [Methanobrevibacter thaueri]
MKLEKIMLITFMLLAVLTIGAVSATDDIVSDNLTVIDDGDSIESSVDNTDLLSEDDDGDDEGSLYINDGLITYKEVAGLETGKEMDSGRLVVIDDNTGDVYFNKTLASMEYNTDMMGYKYDRYNGYYIFKNDLNLTSGYYELNTTYYDDDYNIIESVIGSVYIDKDSYVTDAEVDIDDGNAIVAEVYV